MANWKEIFYAVTKSTNEDAKTLVQNQKDVSDTVIWAEQQTNGKGRNDRIWQSPKGNLYCSFVIENEFSSFISFVSSLAVMETFSSVGVKNQITCKWPNDVLIDGKKISGILLEVCESSLIIGIGINIASSPDNVSYATSSLADFGAKISPKELLEVLKEKMYNNTKLLKESGFEVIRKKWLENAHNLDCEIKVNLINEEVCGKFKGISEQGGLLIDTGLEVHTIYAGDVFYL